MGVAVPVAVTGVGVLTPVADDVASFTAALREGRLGVGRVEGPAGQVFLGAEVGELDFRGLLSRRAALGEEVVDRSHRIARRAPLPAQASALVALEAWERAALHEVCPASDRIGIVVAGNNLAGGYTDRMRRGFERNPAFLRPTYALRYQDSDQVAVVSAALGIKGEGCTVGAASASGNVAIVQGWRMLAAGAAEVCLVVGAMTELSPQEYQGYLNLGAMAVFRPEVEAARQCRPFDGDRCGFVPGQGAACLVLESPESAARRGVRPLAVLLGQAVRLDANHSADPSQERETAVMRAALVSAGLGPADVDYVNTHGTASRLGDDIEARALSAVFGSHAERVWLNSTKALTGHCLSSAGVVEAVSTITQLGSGFVHPNPNLAAPIAPLRFSTATAVEAPLEAALSNGFGLGGFTTSLVIGRAA